MQRRITALQARGFQGQSFNAALSGADLFVGPNGAGKSTRLRAVVAGLRGVARAPGDTTRPYLGPEPTGRITLTCNGGMVARDLSWGDNSKEVVGGKSIEGVRGKIHALFGAHLVSFDLADFVTMTDSTRAGVIKAVCDTAGASGAWDGEKLSAWLRAKLDLPAKPAKVPDGHPILDLWKALPPKDRPIGEWLDIARVWAARTFTEVNAAKTQAEAVASAPAGQSSEEPPAGSRADQEAEVRRLEDELRKVAGVLAALDAASKLVRERQEEGGRLARTLARAEEERDAADANARKVQSLLAPDLDRLRAAVQQAIDAETAATGKCNKNSEWAEAEAEAVRQWRQDVAWVATKATQAREELAGRVSAADTIARLMEGTAKACRHCGGDDPLGMAEDLRRAREAEEQARAALQAAEAAEVEARADLVRAEEGEATARGEGRALEAARKVAETAHREARDRLRVAEGEARVRAERIHQAEEQQARTQVAFADAETALAEWRERQESGDGQVPTLAGDPDALRAQRDGLQQFLDEARRAVAAHIRAETREQARQERIAAREGAQAQWRQVKSLKEALVELSAAVAAEAYRPIETEADRLLAETGLDLRVKFRSEADFGAEDGRGYRVFWCLSDSERALVGAALAVAFARLAKSPWPAILLDRLEMIDSTRLPAVLRALAAGAVRGDWQFMGALVATDPASVPAVDGLKVHLLGPQAAQGEEAA